jgi:hypothetical protein
MSPWTWRGSGPGTSTRRSAGEGSSRPAGLRVSEPQPDIDAYAEALAAGIEAALPTWVVESVYRMMTAWAGRVPPEVAEAAEIAGQRARSDTGAAVRTLLLSDIDDQRTTPLALIRQAVKYPTEVLRQAGVPPVERDRFSAEKFPDDDYDLSPRSFADIDPALAEAGIGWGAAKAFLHRRRHGSTA